MKIACRCGAVIPDQTDYLSYKAHFVADRDWEDFIESSEARRRIDASFVRQCYQCPQCARLYVQSVSKELCAFVPEEHSAAVLGSSKGEDWRAPLIGSWTDKPYAGQANGHLWCDADGGTSAGFDDWNSLELAYHELFAKPRKLNRLRSALLRKNGRDVHSWAPND